MLKDSPHYYFIKYFQRALESTWTKKKSLSVPSWSMIWHFFIVHCIFTSENHSKWQWIFKMSFFTALNQVIIKDKPLQKIILNFNCITMKFNNRGYNIVAVCYITDAFIQKSVFLCKMESHGILIKSDVLLAHIQ